MARLTKEQRVDGLPVAFLAYAYKFKEPSDYGVGPGVVVKSEEATDLIAAAVDFVRTIEDLLREPPVN